MNIKSIIENYRFKMQSAGLLREAGAAQLSPQVAALRPSLTKVNRALAENPDLLRREVKNSPFQILFEYTLPKLEALLNEFGEAKAEKFVEKLCNYGKEVFKQAGEQKADRHLRELFQDLPNYEEILKKSEEEKDHYGRPYGLDRVIEAYRCLHFEGTESFLDYVGLGNVIREGDGSIKLDVAAIMPDPNLIFIGKAENVSILSICLGDIVSSDILKEVAKMRQLRRLHIVSLHTPSKGLHRSEGIDYLASLSDLRELRLSKYDLSRSTLEFLKGMTGLRSITISKCNLSDKALDQIGSFPDLEALDLADNRISDKGIEKLAGLTKLKELNLSGNHNISEGLRHFKGLMELEELNISRTAVKQADVIKLVGQAKKLEVFRWDAAGITDNSALAALPDSLRSLSLRGSTLDDIGLAKIIEKLSELEALHIHNTNVSDASLADIDKLTKLQEFIVSSPKLTDNGLGSIAKLTGLVTLLVGGKISGKGLLQLGRLANLGSLKIDGAKIYNSQLTRLLTQSDLKKLQHVILIDTRVTEKCAEELQEKLGIEIDLMNKSLKDD